MSDFHYTRLSDGLESTCAIYRVHRWLKQSLGYTARRMHLFCCKDNMTRFQNAYVANMIFHTQMALLAIIPLLDLYLALEYCHNVFFLERYRTADTYREIFPLLCRTCLLSLAARFRDLSPGGCQRRLDFDDFDLHYARDMNLDVPPILQSPDLAFPDYL